MEQLDNNLRRPLRFVAEMAVAFGPVRPTRHDVAGIVYKYLPLTGWAGGARNAATSSIILTCAPMPPPPQRGSRSEWRVKKRFTLRVVTCRNSGAC